MDNRSLFRYIKEFTEIYLSTSNKYDREAACLRLQLPLTILPPRKGDLLVGRIRYLPVGMYPQYEGDGLGYCQDSRAFLRLLQADDLTADEKAELQRLFDFWEEENTSKKIFDRYDDELKELLTDGRTVPFDTPAEAFALYRLSGAEMDPTKLLVHGVEGIKKQAEEKMDKNPDFYRGIISVLTLFQEICRSYAGLCRTACTADLSETEKMQLETMAHDLFVIADGKAETFHQAMQLSYLYTLLSGAYNFGRMDVYLGDYLQRDLDSGLLTENEALEYVKSLWSLMDDRRYTFDTRVILGGRDRKNPAAADRFAMLAMETARVMRTVVPQLTLRCYSGMDPAVYDKALEVIGEGTTFPMLYNDDVNIPSVANAFAVDEETAAQYVPFGCGEYVLYNRSVGTPSGTINLLHILNGILHERENGLEEVSSFEELYGRFRNRIHRIVKAAAKQEKLEYDVAGEEAPFLFYSILFEDCMERGLPLLEGGIRHVGGTLESYGNVNTADSLTAIDQLVFRKKLVTPQQLTHALKCNFEGCESLRRLLLAQPKYGNDDETADDMLTRLHEDVCNMVRDEAKEAGLDSYLIVVINNSMNSTFGLGTGPSADGRFGGTFLANANNPVGGRDKNGITAMLNSLVKPKTDCHAGAVQNMRFSKEMFRELLPKMKALLQVYWENGGAQSMITVLSRGDLEAALQEPERYQNLIVRVGGFSAKFVDLDSEVQRELISRTLY